MFWTSTNGRASKPSTPVRGTGFTYQQMAKELSQDPVVLSRGLLKLADEMRKERDLQSVKVCLTRYLNIYSDTEGTVKVRSGF